MLEDTFVSIDVGGKDGTTAMTGGAVGRAMVLSAIVGIFNISDVIEVFVVFVVFVVSVLVAAVVVFF